MQFPLQPIQHKLTLKSMSVLHQILHDAVIVEPNKLQYELQDGLNIVILTRLYQRVRNRFENSKTKITLKPDEALAMLLYFGISNQVVNLHDVVINDINIKTHQVYAGSAKRIVKA